MVNNVEFKYIHARRIWKNISLPLKRKKMSRLSLWHRQHSEFWQNFKSDIAFLQGTDKCDSHSWRRPKKLLASRVQWVSTQRNDQERNLSKIYYYWDCLLPQTFEWQDSVNRKYISCYGIDILKKINCVHQFLRLLD